MSKNIRPSDYKTGREYRWQKKSETLEQTVLIRGLLKLAFIAWLAVLIFTGNFTLAVIIGIAVPLALIAGVFAVIWAKR